MSATVAFAVRTLGPESDPGIVTYLRHATRLLAASGANVFVITEIPINAAAPDSVGLDEATIVPTEQMSDNVRYLDPHVAYSDRVYRTLVGLAHRTHLDAIEFTDAVAEGFITIRAKRTLNALSETTLIVRVHALRILVGDDVRATGPVTIHDSIRRFAEDYSIKHADVVTAASSQLAQYATTHFGRREVRRTPYPIDMSALKPTVFARPDPRRNTVLYVGPMSAQRGLGTFLRTAEILLESEPEFRFEVHGTGALIDPFGQSYADAIRRRLSPDLQNHIAIHRAGGLDERSLAYSRAWYCLLPSQWQGRPYACLEAMAHGCIVIAGTQGATAEMVEHGVSGFVGDPGDPEDFAKPILANRGSRAALVDLSVAAQRRAEHLATISWHTGASLSPYQDARLPRTWRRADHTPKVSVVIPLYNQGRFLREAVESVRASSYSNIEILVVNDGSTDEHTLRIFNDVRGVTKITKTNGGLASARNAGIQMSEGEFILPLDADDRIQCEYIETAVDALVNNSELAYVACYAKNFGQFENVYAPIGCVPDLMLYINTDGRCSSLFRRAALDAVNGYDPGLPFYEDWDLLIRLSKEGFLGDVLPHAYFYYRRHRESMVYTRVNDRRALMIQCLMTKHADVLARHHQSTVFNLVDLWKSGLEVNQSVEAG